MKTNLGVRWLVIAAAVIAALLLGYRLLGQGRFNGTHRTESPGADRPDLHASGVTENFLARRDFAWQQHEYAGGHLHFLANSPASRQAQELADSVYRQQQRLPYYADANDSEPIEVFLVESREQMRQLVGRPIAGMAQVGERTVVLLYNETYRPFIAHELLHMYAHYHWGNPRIGRWITEGYATYVNLPCQGHDMAALEKGLVADGKLRSWAALRRDFDTIDEVDGNLEAASLVGFILREKGPRGVRALWQSDDFEVLEKIFGRSAGQVEADWRAGLDKPLEPARLDLTRLRDHGCETDFTN